MKVLKPIKSELVAAIDIETVRIAENFADLSEEFQSAWRYKNKQEGVVPSDEELQVLWQKNSALYAEFSKVCAISMAYLDNKGKLIVKEYFGTQEKELLEALGNNLDSMIAYNKEFRLVGHAAKFFDYPFMGKRFLINGLSIPSAIDASALKPWEQSNLCTNELWKLGGTGAGSSLQALCTALGIPVSKVDLVGDEVGAAYYRGEYERIGRYCSLDTIATFNIIRRWKAESIFAFEDVTYLNGYSDGDVVEKAQILVLQKIFMDDTFTEEYKEEIRTRIREIGDVDLKLIGEMIASHYIKKADKAGIKREKQAEIDEFLKTI